MTVQKVDEVPQVDGFVKYFQRQLGFLCKQILLAYSEMGLKDYC